MSNSVSELRNNYSSYTFENGLSITDSIVKNQTAAKSQIETWLEG